MSKISEPKNNGCKEQKFVIPKVRGWSVCQSDTTSKILGLKNEISDVMNEISDTKNSPYIFARFTILQI